MRAAVSSSARAASASASVAVIGDGDGGVLAHHLRQFILRSQREQLPMIDDADAVAQLFGFFHSPFLHGQIVSSQYSGET